MDNVPLTSTNGMPLNAEHPRLRDPQRRRVFIDKGSLIPAVSVVYL